jgi:hypothetical protein
MMLRFFPPVTLNSFRALKQLARGQKVTSIRQHFSRGAELALSRELQFVELLIDTPPLD